jgi:hypothetical protein
VILLVTGGREYSMKPADWLRLDALHFPSSLSPEALARCYQMQVEHGGPTDAMLEAARRYPGPVTAVYEGEADGADTCARAWAESRGIPVRPFEVTRADWKEHGKAAGPRRNTTMLAAAMEEAEIVGGDVVLVVAFPGGPGTADMVEQAARARRQHPGAVRILDFRDGPAQRWTAEDVQAVQDTYESLRCGGDPEGYSWETAIMTRWLERGGQGMPLCSAHLWTMKGGKVELPTAACSYIGRYDHRHGIPEGVLANPFKLGEHDPETILERYRSHLRSAYQRHRGVQTALRTLKPWTLLVCWCHATRPCHGTVAADAIAQVQAAIELKAAGRDLPAPHWTTYKLANRPISAIG